MPRPMPCFIAGSWSTPADAPLLDITEAATGQITMQLPLAGAADAQAAMRAARAAFPAWSALSPQQRAGYLLRIADALDAAKDGIATAISREVGMPLKLSERVQVGAPIMAWRRLAAVAEGYAWQETIGNSLVERVPAGVAVCITPWNYPLHQITGKVAPALLAGCTVVLKPAEIAPSAALAFAEAVKTAGLPDGVFNMVIGTGAEAGAALVAAPEADVISFTGSTAVGAQIGAAALSAIKRVTLELGGKSAAVVLPGADLALAVRATVGGCFLNSGQTCSALTRLLVPADQHDAAVALVTEAVGKLTPGDPLDPATRLGPLISAAQRDRVRGYISRAVAAGATLACGGGEPPEGLGRGFFVRPTVLAGVDPDSEIAQQEVFGPVLCILPYADANDALRIANGTPYGLAGAVWGPDEATALDFARQLRTGQVDINGGPFNLDAPFGGFGRSGVGRENGRFGLDDFLEYRSLQLPVRKG